MNDIIKSVDRFYGDTSRSKEDALEELNRLRDHVEDLIEALEEEVENG